MLDIVAYHEAGHAIACRALGVPINTCWIEDRVPTPIGMVEHPNPVYEIVGERGVTAETYSAEVEAAYLKTITILMAGEAAQRRYEPSSVDGLASALDKDRDAIDELLGFVNATPEQRERMRADCESAARQLVEQRWPEIDTLAQTLLGANASFG